MLETFRNALLSGSTYIPIPYLPNEYVEQNYMLVIRYSVSLITFTFFPIWICKIPIFVF